MHGKVLVTGSSVSPELLKPLEDEGLTISNPLGVLTESELRNELRDASAYLLGGEEYASSTAISEASALRVIAFLGVGYQTFVDEVAATKAGITITITPNTLNDSVAEFTVGQLLNLRRKLTHYTNVYRAGSGGSEEKQFDLRGRRFSILGMGGIGTRVAEILRLGFHCNISYYSRTRKPELEEKLGIEWTTLNNLVADSDGLIVLVPGNDSTFEMVDWEVLRLAAPGFLLVNTARPEVVAAEALEKGLQSGLIEAAAYDAFYKGDKGAQLLAAFDDSRLLVTARIASLTNNARDAMARKAIASILNVLKNGTDSNRVN